MSSPTTTDDEGSFGFKMLCRAAGADPATAKCSTRFARFTVTSLGLLNILALPINATGYFSLIMAVLGWPGLEFIFFIAAILLATIVCITDARTHCRRDLRTWLGSCNQTKTVWQMDNVGPEGVENRASKLAADIAHAQPCRLPSVGVGAAALDGWRDRAASLYRSAATCGVVRGCRCSWLVILAEIVRRRDQSADDGLKH